MKILVAIASHGHRNDAYLQQLLNEYASMPHEVKVVVVSNEPRDLGPDVEGLVGAPTISSLLVSELSTASTDVSAPGKSDCSTRVATL